MIAWQTYIVVGLSAMAFAIAQVLDSTSGVELTPLTAIMLKTLAFTVPLLTNLLKTIGSQAPNTSKTTTETTTTPTPETPPNP